MYDSQGLGKGFEYLTSRFAPLIQRIGPFGSHRDGQGGDFLVVRRRESNRGHPLLFELLVVRFRRPIRHRTHIPLGRLAGLQHDFLDPLRQLSPTRLADPVKEPEGGDRLGLPASRFGDLGGC